MALLRLRLRLSCSAPRAYELVLTSFETDRQPRVSFFILRALTLLARSPSLSKSVVAQLAAAAVQNPPAFLVDDEPQPSQQPPIMAYTNQYPQYPPQRSSISPCKTSLAPARPATFRSWERLADIPRSYGPPPQGYPPQGYPPQGYPPQQYAPQQYAPQQMQYQQAPPPRPQRQSKDRGCLEAWYVRGAPRPTALYRTHALTGVLRKSCRALLLLCLRGRMRMLRWCVFLTRGMIGED